MKRILPALAIALLLTAFCNFFPGENEEKEANENINAPHDWFMQQRSWPDATFDVDAFKQAMDIARNGRAMYKNLPSGFSRGWTLQGPTNIGGRLNTIAVDPTDTSIIYTGSANGGIFKTTDAGKTWKPIFDDHSYLGISHILIDPKNHNTVYVGTGDANISGDPVIGDGIYKSTDAGKSWIHLGLSQGKIISKIILHPDSANIMYAACMGNPFARDANRGFYKSSDSGKTWNKILFIDNQSGIIDAVIDPKDPSVFYAAAWTRIRTNRESTLISTANKLYKSTDRGVTWNILSNGLPSYKVSRIGISISPKNHNDLYSIIVDTNLDLEGVYKSNNAGKNWSKMSTAGLPKAVMGNFGWYFGKVYINPQNDSDIYFGAIELWHYSDTTQSWYQETPPWYGYSVHADKHDLQWTGKGKFLIATDGGLYRHDVATGAWSDADEIPNTQFYHTAIDPYHPETFYGGAQDNGTLSGSSSNLAGWQRLLGGDGFRPAFDKDDSDILYGEIQNGVVYELSHSSFSVHLVFDNSKRNDKCNWDMPYMVDKYNSSIIYAGTDKMYSNLNGNDKYDLRAISPNLTDSNIYGAAFHNLSCMDQSPITAKIFLVGTADGNVWKSTDGGNKWDSITAGLPDRYVTAVLASPMDKNTVYVAHSGYKYNETIPHLHKSTDLGKNWVDISGDLPPVAVNDIWVYPKNDSMIFVATDAGVYGSINAGTNWFRLGANMPIFPVLDIKYNPIKHVLVAATFARSLMTYPMDSILHEFSVTGIKTATEEVDIKVYPNPVVENINISLGKFAESGKIKIQLFDIGGKLLRDETVQAQGIITLQAANLHPGIYFLQVGEKDKVKRIKILKI